MKTTLPSWISSALFTLLLASLPANSPAQTTNHIIDQFDTDTSALYVRNWGATIPTITWDTSVNATTTMGPNNPGSGSTRWDVNWVTGDQFMFTRTFGATLDLRVYTNISFDLRFDPTSSTTADGTSRGFFEIDWVPQSDGWPSTPNTPPGLTVPITNNWIHVSLPIDQNSTKLGAVTAIGFKMQANGTGSLLTGTQTFWLDNIILGAQTNAPPGPSMTLAPVNTPPGLTIVASGGGNDYKRGMVRTVDTFYSWVGRGDTPVTYSLSITNYPGPAYSFFQSEIFLAANGGNDTSIDYNAASVAVLDVRNLADGTAIAVFRYKTNTPYANANIVLATLPCPTGPLGTWSISFLNDTNVTMTAPGGATTNFFFPDATAVQTAFGGPVTAYFGNMQNGASQAGQSSTYSRARIQGVIAVPEIDDTFATLDPARWQIVCDYPSDVFVMQPTDKYWVRWTLPDTGYGLESTANVAAWWSSPGLTNIVITKSDKRVVVPQSALPAAGMGFFRMSKTNTAP